MEKTERTRRRFRFHHLAAVGIAVALLAGPIAAFAADDFPDVPNGHPFHDEIGWLAGTGITTGFPDGTYKPGQAVTRQSMAAFMQRFYNMQAGLTAVDFGTNGALADGNEATWETVATTTVVVPAGTSAKIVSTFAGDAFCNGGDNIFLFFAAVRPQCLGRITVQAQSSGLPTIPVPASPGQMVLMDSDDAQLEPDNLIDGEGFSMTAQSASVTLAPNTYTVRAQINHDDSDTGSDEVVFDVGAFILTSTVHLNDAPTL